MALADFQTLVTSMVPADGRYSDVERDSALQLAVGRYSQDVPRQLVNDVIWTADGYFGPMPADWVEGAELQVAEYPVGEVPPTVLDLVIYMEPGPVFKLMSPDSLQAAEVVRVNFSAPHLLVGGLTPQDTVPLLHREAVASYAASLLCRQLATFYANERDTSINADGSNTDSRARNFSSRAREYRAAYYAGIGKADPQGSGGSSAGAEASGAVTSWPGRSRGSLTRMEY